MKMNRREFIKVSSITGLLAAFAPASLLKAKEEKTIVPSRLHEQDEIGTVSDTILRINSQDVGEITEVSMSSPVREAIDISTMATPPGYREFMQGFKTSELDMRLNYTSKGNKIINRVFECGEAQDIMMVMKNSQFTFRGYVTEVQHSVDVGRPIEIEMKIKVEGDILTTIEG